MSTQPSIIGMPQGDEWAEGMPAYWLRLSLAQPDPNPAAASRIYYLSPTAPRPGATYDQRLIVRVGGTEQAVTAVVDFVFRYAQSMDLLKSRRSIHIVQEHLVRAWELAGRPGVA